MIFSKIIIQKLFQIHTMLQLHGLVTNYCCLRTNLHIYQNIYRIKNNYQNTQLLLVIVIKHLKNNNYVNNVKKLSKFAYYVKIL